MTQEINAKPCPSEVRGSSKKQFLLRLFGLVNALGGILRFVDKAWEWWQKFFGDSN